MIKIKDMYGNDFLLKEENVGMALAIFGDVLECPGLSKPEKSFDWEYTSPQKYIDLITDIPLPKSIEKAVQDKTNLLSKELVHKQQQENVLLTEYEKYGDSIIFGCKKEWKELKSDHQADHVDGIKLFEVIRQATLAAYHINNLSFDTATALMNLNINYLKYVESFADIVVQIIPVNRPDGGAMFTIFGIYQFNKLVATGYLGTYAFRSKELFKQKRMQMKEEARRIAKV